MSRLGAFRYLQIGMRLASTLFLGGVFMTSPFIPSPTVSPDSADLTDWRTSSFCSTGACIQVAGSGEHVAVRDSKSHEGPSLRFTREEFSAFIRGAKAGEFDDV